MTNTQSDLCECCVVGNFVPNQFHDTICKHCLHGRAKHVTLDCDQLIDVQTSSIQWPNVVTLNVDGISTLSASHFECQSSALHTTTKSTLCSVIGGRRLCLDLLNELTDSLGDAYQDSSDGEDSISAASIHIHSSHVSDTTNSLLLTSVESHFPNADDLTDLFSLTPTLLKVSGCPWYCSTSRIPLLASDIVLCCSPYPVCSTETFSLVTDLSKLLLQNTSSGLTRYLVIVGVGEENTDSELGRRFSVLFDKGDSLSVCFHSVDALQLPDYDDMDPQNFVDFCIDLRRLLQKLMLQCNRQHVIAVPNVNVPSPSFFSSALTMINLSQFFIPVEGLPIIVELVRVASLYLARIGSRSDYLIGSSLMSMIQILNCQLTPINEPETLQSVLTSTVTFFSIMSGYHINFQGESICKTLLRILLALLPCSFYSDQLSCSTPCFSHKFHRDALLSVEENSSLRFSRWESGFPILKSGDWVDSELFTNDVLFDCYRETINQIIAIDDVLMTSSLIELVQPLLFDPSTEIYHPLVFCPPTCCSICFEVFTTTPNYFKCGHGFCENCTVNCSTAVEPCETCFGGVVDVNFCVVCGEVVEVLIEAEADDVLDVLIEDESQELLLTVDWETEPLIEGQQSVLNVVAEGLTSKVKLNLFKYKDGRQFKNIQSFLIEKSCTLTYTPSNSDVGFSIKAIIELTDQESSVSSISSTVSPALPRYTSTSLENVTGEGRSVHHNHELTFYYNYQGGNQGPSIISWVRITPNKSSVLIKKGKLSSIGDDDSGILSYKCTSDDITCIIKLEATPVRFDSIKGPMITLESPMISVLPMYLRPISSALDKGGVSFKLRLWSKDTGSLEIIDTIVIRFGEGIGISDSFNNLLCDFPYSKVDLFECDDLPRGILLTSVKTDFKDLILSTLNSKQPADLIVLTFRKFRSTVMNYPETYHYSRYTPESRDTVIVSNPLLRRR
ncbi:hypothetical protein GEMRC1_002072 [Eukaryota sp. GEM-RC1]